MQDIPFTQILVLLAFILFPLINWLLQRMQRRFESQAPRQTASATCTSDIRETAAHRSHRFGKGTNASCQNTRDFTVQEKSIHQEITFPKPSRSAARHYLDDCVRTLPR